jgi:hypothetical protein
MPLFDAAKMDTRRLAIAISLAVVGVFCLGATALAAPADQTTVTATATPTPSSTSTPTVTATTAATATSVPSPTQTATVAATATGTPQPTLTLNPQQAPPGTSVAGLGAFFLPGDTVNLLFNGNQVDSETANTSGTVSFQFSVPSLGPGQYQVVANGQTRGSASLTFTVAGSQLTLSTDQGPPGSSLTVTGTSFKPGETVNVFFNGAQVGAPIADTNGSFQITFKVPQLPNGDYQIDAKGQSSGLTSSQKFTVGGTTVTLSAQSGVAGTSVTANGAGFVPGDSVQLIINGVLIDSQNADTSGNVTFTFTVPQVRPGNYLVVLSGRSGGIASAPFAVLSSAPVATPSPVTTVTATPTPASFPPPAAAPTVPHDNQYFSQTGFRIDNDAVWSFFQGYGGVQTFGYPTSRTFTFLGCPVQFFQRQVIQVCTGAGAALLNILDPGIFPYTKVNGSTFPAPNDQMKASTPPVSDPNYDANMAAFVQANVPNTFSGQPVAFYDYFNSQGGLTIWGAPISMPAPDPNNNSFIYQRFQRGIMHFIQGTGTESILVADYLKALILNQNVPTDLRAEATAQNSPYLASYCPGAPAWMCRPNQVPGTDYTFAFVQG